MMKFRGRFGALAIGAVLTGGAAQAETLTDALIAAYRTSDLLEQNRAVLRASDEDVALAISTLRPVIAFLAQSTYINPTVGNDITTTLGLSADITLYSGGQNRIAVEAAKETVLATREALVSVEQQVLLSAVQAYMDVRSAVEFVQLRESNVRVIGQELQAAQDRFQVGEVTRTDVAVAEAALAQARSQLASAQGDLNIAREVYRRITGAYPGVLSLPPRTPAIPATLDAAKSIGARNHPEVMRAQHLVTAAEFTVARARAGILPRITAGAQLGVDQDGNDSKQVQLQLSQPIYAGGQISATFRQSFARADQSRSGLLDTTKIILQNVGTSWAQLNVAKATLASSDEQIRAAQAAFDGLREEAKQGARTTLDVLNSEQDLLDARATKISNVSQQYVAVYSLLSSMGLLTVSHLNLGIPTYDPSSYYNAVRNAPPTSTRGKRLDRVLKSIGRK